jgi:hypothetical protein
LKDEEHEEVEDHEEGPEASTFFVTARQTAMSSEAMYGITR